MTRINEIVEIPTSTGRIRIGQALPFTLFAGPCAMESRDHALETAHAIQEITQELGIGLIYKSSFDKANRTSAQSARGIGLDEAISIFSEIRERYHLPVVTDVHKEEHCTALADVIDVLQIPAFLSRQTDLLVAAAKTGRVVKVKKGQFLAPWDMKHAVAKVAGAGNPNVLITERGASFGYNTLVTDFRAIPVMARETGVPIIFDATHSVQEPGGRGASSGGQREMVPTLARAAAAVGVAGLFVETHPDPDNAPSDGPNMIPLHLLKSFLTEIKALDEIAKARPSLHGFNEPVS